jgi:hypothetical protein
MPTIYCTDHDADVEVETTTSIGGRSEYTGTCGADANDVHTVTEWE